ncbi:Fic/DOC family protein [Planococcus lenghuensis]|uniref:protein adenylyltransferase n=1 Tax=Planococcus lenghuensis TaxID=2213202 RepID=A0A1Q2L3L7_9BACL|nr:Fic family protein [Planococcus lenghuensis]AQQ54472.1 cell filamentation protein Fic [Planococcus lenghuensis]
MSKYRHTSMYCYPGTDVLVNKFGIQDEEKLKEVEKVYTLYRLSELYVSEPAVPADLNALIRIHYQIFQDIYAFAGELRKEMISKGHSSFAHPDFIEPQLKRIFKELEQERYLRGKNRYEVIPRLAYYLSELNALHPFREGNGRTIREFARQLMLGAGHEVRWEQVEEPAFIINAFVDSFYGNNEKLEGILAEIIQ